ncbi:MAG: sigma-70 family RNA polymerase sigma factor [Enhydrobacter sp.]|nr:sigma-70 family RNA polymerase sigma factor [Enhydrobacter sp.]
MDWAADTLHLYSTHRAALVEYALPIVGDRARAEDVVQEAFLKFSPQQALNSDVQRPLGYLYRIVRNLALDLSRRRAAEERVLRDDRSWWLTPTSIRTPEQDFSHKEHLREIDRMLESSSSLVRDAVNLHRTHGFTLQQIADALGVSVTSAHRAVREGLGLIALQLSQPDD